MGKAVNKEQKNEIERDEASRFVAEKYVSNGYSLHYHRNLEIYGVVRGSVVVTIGDMSMTLTDGQMAVIEGLQSHCYEMEEETEVMVLHIGTRYLRNFVSLYPNKRLPQWLLDVEYNKGLHEDIEKIAKRKQGTIPEMKRIGMACQLLSDIIEHYGMVDENEVSGSDHDLIGDVIQYIYDHYDESITLETLSKVFFISPKALSKKLRKRLNVDLRVFVNDIRVQKAVQMIDDSKNRDKTMNEIASMCGFKNMGTFYRSYERNFKSRKIDKEFK